MMKAKAYPPQIDAVNMEGQYNATAEEVRAFIKDRLEGLGERYWLNGKGLLVGTLNNNEGTHALRITQRGRSVRVCGSLAKWGGVKEEGRSVLPDEEVQAVVSDVLDLLGLNPKWVKVHSVEYGIDVLVEGRLSDYAPYLRMAKGHKPKKVDGAKGSHYQGTERATLKVYDKGKEAGIPAPEGTSLLRFEYERENGASSIGKYLGLGTPLHAEDLTTDRALMALKRIVIELMNAIIPTGVAEVEHPSDVATNVAVQMLEEKYGAEWRERFISLVEEQAKARYTHSAQRDRAKKSATPFLKEIQTEQGDRFTALRDAINEQA